MTLSINFTKKLRDFTLNFALESNQDISALLGASGSGKTMILKCISGIETPDSGFISFNGRTLFDSEKKINLKPQERNVGYLFQNYALFPHFNVAENIACGLKNKKDKQKIDDFLQLFHLEQFTKSYPAKLSGGQQQRVALARLLASEPEIILLDEPFSALDQFLRENLEMEMKNLLKEYGRDTLLVTHHRDEAYRLCEHLVILENGKVLENGNLKEIFEFPQYLASAKLTGCKNFSTVKRFSDFELFAEDWGVSFTVNKKIAKEISYIGIRGHSFYPVDSLDKPNSFEVKLKDQAETPFEQQFFLQTKNNGTIWWATSKKSGIIDCPKYLAIAPENIYLLKNE